MTYRITIEIPGLPSLQGFRARGGHWSKGTKHDRAWQAHVRWRLQLAGLPEHPLERAFLTLTRRSSRAPDYDNLVASFKPLVDSLRPHEGFRGVIVDDSMDHITSDYRWTHTTDKLGGVTIEVEER